MHLITIRSHLISECRKALWVGTLANIPTVGGTMSQQSSQYLPLGCLSVIQETIKPLVLLKLSCHYKLIKLPSPLSKWKSYQRIQTQTHPPTQSNSAQLDVSDAGHVRACVLAPLFLHRSLSLLLLLHKKQAGLQGMAWTAGGRPALPSQLIKEKERERV